MSQPCQKKSTNKCIHFTEILSKTSQRNIYQNRVALHQILCTFVELCDQTNIGGHFDQLLDLNMGFLMEYCWGIE